MIDKDKLKNSRVAIIDADSIAFIIGWNYKDSGRTDQVIAHTDDFIHSMLQATQCRHYIGMLSPKAEVKNFRDTIAVTQLYKGNRPEKPEWHKVWAKIIEDHLINYWGFIRGPGDMETDDIVVALHTYLNTIPSCTPILCGNDKDALQSPGHHYNFRTNLGAHYTPEQSSYNLFFQVLMGDKTDNIPGLAGCGKVGAHKILSAEGIDITNHHMVALYAYTTKLGVDKGIQSFYEMYMLCKMRSETPVNHYELLGYDLDRHAHREAASFSAEEVEHATFNFSQMGDTDSMFTVGGGDD